jgi:Rod binding domain-containing protein
MSIEKAAARPSPLTTPRSQDLERKRLKESCQEFESFLTQHLLKSMDDSILRAEEPDQARETYEGMFRETLSGELSQHSKGGIGDLLYQRLAPLLEGKAEANPSPARDTGPSQVSGRINR